MNANLDSPLRLKALRCAVVIPTYNNATTIEKVIHETKKFASDIIVVNDGSTDQTAEILANINDIHVLEYPDKRNRGKGFALKTGLDYARDNNFRYAITLDSDGQHFPADIPIFIDQIEQDPDTMIIGARNLNADGMPSKNTFANRFSNFWFFVETGKRLVDTQSGFRLYPLDKMHAMHLFSKRYEFEVEVIVRLAWRFVDVVNVPIHVIYPEDRVSHFRPFRDFSRISLLNALLFFGAIFYYYPKKFFRWISPRNIYKFFDENLFRSNESATVLALSVAVGISFGLSPIWGFQMIAAIAVAVFFRLNKILVIAFSNISLPPFIPFIIYASMRVGGTILGVDTVVNPADMTVDIAMQSLLQYILGSIILALACGTFSFFVTFALLSLLRRK